MATKIKAEILIAETYADKAIIHAKIAGELLLDVKKKLPHGSFLAWVKENIPVTERQAQRYMAAALGKPTPIRAIAHAEVKNDTVSHLPTWIPKNGDLAIAEFLSDDELHEWLEVQEISHAPGYFYVAYISTGSIDWTKRGVRADCLEETIIDWLPGRLTRKTAISEFNWQYSSIKNNLYETIIKPFNAMPKICKAA